MAGRIRKGVRDLKIFREFSQPPLPTSVLMRLKSVIALLKYFSGKIINTDGVSSKHTYRPMRARCYLKYSLRENEGLTFYYIDSIYSLVSQIVGPMYNIKPSY